MTTSFVQEAVNDDTNTDQILMKFDIMATFVINTNYTSFIAPFLTNLATGQPVAAPAEIMTYIRSRLLQKRKTLSVNFNGKELIPQKQTGINGTVDAMNGPDPKSCRITQLTSITFLVDFHIVAHYWENLQTIVAGNTVTFINKPGNSVLSNRWTETVDIDNCMYSTRTRHGKFQIRSDNVSGYIADQLRSQFAVTGVPVGFLRQRSNYVVSPDGLTLSYTIVDQEQFKMPPDPAFEATGTYREWCSRLGVRRYGSANVSLKGAKTTAQGDLITACVAVCREKIRIALNQQSQPGLFQGLFPNVNPVQQPPITESFQVTVAMYANEVSCEYTAMFRNSQVFNPGGLTGDRFTVTPGSQQGTNDFTPEYFDRGTASILLQAAAYYDPSLPGNQLTQAGNQATDDNPVTLPGFVQMLQGLVPGQAGKNG